jgi:hypothetical protein
MKRNTADSKSLLEVLLDVDPATLFIIWMIFMTLLVLAPVILKFVITVKGVI